jgi:DNA-binding PadR family transcriptional regulator
MTIADLNAFLLRALKRKAPQTEDELIMSARNVFQEECKASAVRQRLSDLDEKGYVSTVMSDGITPSTYALTKKGDHTAQNL